MLATGENPHGQACPSNQEERNVFGCDEKSDEPWSVDCPMCVDGCDLCDGGEIIFHRCPAHEIDMRAIQVIKVWTLLREHKTWPVAGGLDNQAAWFVDAVAFLDQEAAAYRKREMERMKNA